MIERKIFAVNKNYSSLTKKVKAQLAAEFDKTFGKADACTVTSGRSVKDPSALAARILHGKIDAREEGQDVQFCIAVIGPDGKPTVCLPDSRTDEAAVSLTGPRAAAKGTYGILRDFTWDAAAKTAAGTGGAQWA